jgi:hypothetical protein
MEKTTAQIQVADNVEASMPPRGQESNSHLSYEPHHPLLYLDKKTDILNSFLLHT